MKYEVRNFQVKRTAKRTETHAKVSYTTEIALRHNTTNRT